MMTEDNNKREATLDKLRVLAEFMIEIACELEYYGGFDDGWVDKSKEMRGAAFVARDWASQLESEIEDPCDETSCRGL